MASSIRCENSLADGLESKGLVGMRLLNFHIKNYKSIFDSGVISVSEIDNVLVLAGQNESGKSSILSALSDYELDDFDEESVPFSSDPNLVQTVSCTYKFDESDDIEDILMSKLVKESDKFTILDETDDIDTSQLSKIKSFTISRIKGSDGERLDIDSGAFDIFLAAIQDSPLRSLDAVTLSLPENEEALGNLRHDIAKLFYFVAPSIVLFDGQCDLLPDRIYISSLTDNETEVEGYRAVRNLEKILGTNFVTKEKERDALRSVNEEVDNNVLKVNFQDDWGQRIHEDNEVVVKYIYEKRDGIGETGSYINFYVETRDRIRLAPRQRSKGLIWFLSLWLELKAQNMKAIDLVLLLDEPDQHLHVKAQQDVLNLMNNLSARTENRPTRQIIYATHSPYLIDVKHLSRIKLVTNSKLKGTKAEDLTSSKFDTVNKQDALQPIASAIGYQISGLSSYGARNVILEGVSDFYYFTAMRKLMARSSDYSFIPGIGVRKLNSLISNCIGYGLQWVALMDADSEKGGKDSKKKFEEIRDDLFDGDDKAASQKLMILDGIVGVENMFTLDDLRLVFPISGSYRDMTKAVGNGRKVFFASTFFDLVNAGKILSEDLSQESKDNFERAFEFVEQSFGL